MTLGHRPNSSEYNTVLHKSAIFHPGRPYYGRRAAPRHFQESIAKYARQNNFLRYTFEMLWGGPECRCFLSGSAHYSPFSTNRVKYIVLPKLVSVRCDAEQTHSMLWCFPLCSGPPHWAPRALGRARSLGSEWSKLLHTQTSLGSNN